MIVYYFLLALYIGYFINEFVKQRIFHLHNVFVIFFFLRFYIFSPLISEGIVFKPFFRTYFITELQNIYNYSAAIILITLLISRELRLSCFRVQFNLRKNGLILAEKIFLFFVLYTIVYYSVMGVTPPILSPFFGESTLVNRLKLTHNKINEPLIFYGNTIIKDYLIPFMGTCFIFYTFKHKKFIIYSIITFFLISYIGRKSSIANFLIFLSISLYSFEIISKKTRNYIFGLGIISLFLLFIIYGKNNLIEDVALRTFVTESSFSYQLYDEYIDDPKIGINIFNFPGSEYLLGIEHYDIKKEIYSKTFPSRTSGTGNRNAQGFGLLFLILGFGKYIGISLFFIVSILTFILLRTIQKSIFLNKNNPFYFGLYYLLLTLSLNYFGVNIFSIFDLTLINFKFLILFALIYFINSLKIYKYELIK